MAEILLFHHVQGLTAGVLAFADELRGAGHIVHTPDLFGGRTFDTIDEGMAYANSEDAGARGALLFESCVSITADWAFGPWPDGVPVQIHGMDHDPFFAGEGDIDAARELVEIVGPSAEMFVYPGDAHLFADSSLPSYDAEAAALLTERVLSFREALA